MASWIPVYCLNATNPLPRPLPSLFLPWCCIYASVNWVRIGSDNGLSPVQPAPSHYLNQCWVIVSWTLRNKLQWNFNRNTKLFIYENVSENIICEMAAIFSRGRWVNIKRFTDNEKYNGFLSFHGEGFHLICFTTILRNDWKCKYNSMA